MEIGKNKFKPNFGICRIERDFREERLQGFSISNLVRAWTSYVLAVCPSLFGTTCLFPFICTVSKNQKTSSAFLDGNQYKSDEAISSWSSIVDNGAYCWGDDETKREPSV